MSRQSIYISYRQSLGFHRVTSAAVYRLYRYTIHHTSLPRFRRTRARIRTRDLNESLTACKEICQGCRLPHPYDFAQFKAHRHCTHHCSLWSRIFTILVLCSSYIDPIHHDLAHLQVLLSPVSPLYGSLSRSLLHPHETIKPFPIPQCVGCPIYCVARGHNVGPKRSQDEDLIVFLKDNQVLTQDVAFFVLVLGQSGPGNSHFSKFPPPPLPRCLSPTLGRA